MSPDEPRTRRARLRDALGARLSPEGTRTATFFERLTVRRLPWLRVVQLNHYFELFGKLATALWLVFVATVVLGVDWRQVVENVANAGRPVRGALALAIIVPTLVFVAARSSVGFARWRLQRELWRRDVERLDALDLNPSTPDREA